MAQLVVPTGTFSRMRDVDVNRLLASRSLESTEGSPKNPNILGEIVRIVRIRSHGSVGRAHRSHRWGHRFESCCDHQHGKVLVNQGLFFFVLSPAEGAAFPRRQGAILDVNKMNDQPVHASRCERLAGFDVNGYPARCERFAGQTHFL